MRSFSTHPAISRSPSPPVWLPPARLKGASRRQPHQHAARRPRSMHRMWEAGTSLEAFGNPPRLPTSARGPTDKLQACALERRLGAHRPRNERRRRAHPRATGQSPSPNRCPVLLLPSFKVARARVERAGGRDGGDAGGKGDAAGEQQRREAGAGRAMQGCQRFIHVLGRVPRPPSLRSPLASVWLVEVVARWDDRPPTLPGVSRTGWPACASHQ
jgi:hypothetical protein